MNEDSNDSALLKIKSQRKLNDEYWIKRGFSTEEAKIKVFEFQSENSKKLKQKKQKNPAKYENTLPTQLGYWIKKTNGDIDYAKILLKQHQTTFSLEICIEKFGEIDGLRVWKARQLKWKAKVFNENSYIGQGTSILCNNIINDIIKIEHNLLYGKHEKFIYDKEYKRAYKYDITKPSTKKIIEVNGIYWHCKPSLYESSYIHKIRKMTAENIWEFDKRKRNIAEKYGYTVLVIWEDEYYNDPQLIINRCLKFLKDE